MNKIFVKTQNVKNFIGLVENLINKPKNIPKMGLVYGEPGLGKSQTALWLACKYDGIYLRASNLMTGRWLLEEMVKELDEIPRFLSSDNFNIVVKKLKQKPQVIFIDEIDYLMNNYKTIETLRDIHDETGCPIIFIGMGLAHRKLERLLNEDKLVFEQGLYKYKEPEQLKTFDIFEKPIYKGGERILFKNIAIIYLNNRRLTKDTLKGYRSQLKYNILPFFEGLYADEITYEKILGFVEFMKKKFKPKTASNGVTLLGSILKYAFMEGYIKNNPYFGVRNSMCK